MKRGERNYTSHLINIRRQKRQMETQQLKNTLRFSAELNTLLQQGSNDSIVNELTNEEVQVILDRQDYDTLLNAVINGSHQVLQTLEEYILPVLARVMERLSIPSGALALWKLCKHSSLAVAIIFQQKRFVDVVGQLKRLSKGSKEQNIYLSCIIEMLNAKHLVQRAQLAPLFPLLQELFYQQLMLHNEHNLIIMLTTRLIYFTDTINRFSIEFIVDFLQYFWCLESKVNVAGIYLSAVDVVGMRAYNRSITVLINVIRVVLRGRGKLPEHIDKDTPTVVSIIGSIFKNYNDQQEKMEQFGVIMVDGHSTDITLHQFLLQYEFAIFQQRHLDESYLQFLLEFCRNGPIEEICQVWSKLGLLELMIKQMPISSASTCLLSLQVCLALLQRGTEFSTVPGSLLKLYLIQQTISEVLEAFSAGAIQSLCSALLEQLRSDIS